MDPLLISDGLLSQFVIFSDFDVFNQGFPVLLSFLVNLVL
jgi:hypothetical protein